MTILTFVIPAGVPESRDPGSFRFTQKTGMTDARDSEMTVFCYLAANFIILFFLGGKMQEITKLYMKHCIL